MKRRSVIQVAINQDEVVQSQQILISCSQLRFFFQFSNFNLQFIQQAFAMMRLIPEQQVLCIQKQGKTQCPEQLKTVNFFNISHLKFLSVIGLSITLIWLISLIEATEQKKPSFSRLSQLSAVQQVPIHPRAFHSTEGLIYQSVINQKMNLEDQVKQQSQMQLGLINKIESHIQKLNNFKVNQQHFQITNINVNQINNQHLPTPSKYILTNSQDSFANGVKTVQSQYLKSKYKKQNIAADHIQKGGIFQIQPSQYHDLLAKNQEGLTIQQVLYDKNTIEKRKLFHRERMAIVANTETNEGLHLSIYNIKINHTMDTYQNIIIHRQYELDNIKYQLQDVHTQLPICIIIPSYNNNANFRIQYNLNSVFTQNYSNYFAVIINDASIDGSDEIYRKYLQFYNINPQKYVLINNKQRKKALQNIYIASHDYCSYDSIVLNLDGDDELLGRNVLKIFNAQHQKYKSGVLYSNFYWFNQAKPKVMGGFTQEYSDQIKKDNAYRQVQQHFSQLRSYRNKLFLQIKRQDLIDGNGQFYDTASDMAIYFPLMELSCGRVNKIQGFHYLYNIFTGLNDFQQDSARQMATNQLIRSKQKYTCDINFKNQMIQ